MELLERVASYPCISFDVFDTAILRPVARPGDVFALVGDAYRDRHRLAGDRFDFGAERRRAEERAREGGPGEVTLAAIYAELRLPRAWCADQLRELELRFEERLCTRNPFIHSVYLAACRLGKRVVFTSDMYLPQTVVESILRRNGYPSFQQLYLSSALGVTKSSGELFTHVLRDLAVPAHELLHIGDNYQADFWAARKRGVESFYYRRPAVPAPASGERAEVVHQGLVRRKSAELGRDFWYRLGYDAVGILCTGFALWLRRSVRADRVERLFFLSRDGWLLKRAFDRVETALGPSASSHYLYSSRRAVYLPAIVQLDEVSLDRLSFQREPRPVGDLLERLGLRAGEHSAAIAAAGFASERELVPPRDRRMRRLLRSLQAEIRAAASAERNVMLEYFDQMGVSAGRVGLVDIGWRGTVQACMQSMLDTRPAPVGLRGYYLGTLAASRPLTERGLSLSGFLCDGGEPVRRARMTDVGAGMQILEFMLGADHPSVRGMRRGAGGIEPVFSEGDASPAQCERRARLQQGAIDFLDDFLRILTDCPWLEVSAEVASAPLHRLLTSPTRDEAEQLGELIHGDGYARRPELRRIAAPPSRLRAAVDPVSAVLGFRHADWQSGYATRLFGTSLLARAVRAAMVSSYRLARELKHQLLPERTHHAAGN